MKELYMKKVCVGLVLLVFGLPVFAQQAAPVVVVAPLQVSGGYSQDDADTISDLLMTELAKSIKLKVADRNSIAAIEKELGFQVSDWSNDQKTGELGRALNASYIVRGRVTKLGGRTVITTNMLDINAMQVVYPARIQLSDEEIFDKIPGFVSDMLDELPDPNIPDWLVGTWEAVPFDNDVSFKGYITFEKNGEVRSSGLVSYYNVAMRSLAMTGSGKVSGTFSCRNNTITFDLKREEFGIPFFKGTCPYTWDGAASYFKITHFYRSGNTLYLRK
jgi:TolB-like protein